ncbi:MAG: leucine-rich repeat domain-containing protein, partial [Butyrivibrio sp.]|nr:leucine-rich repeat domain-containing protein [Butyrivibrio sp.]
TINESNLAVAGYDYTDATNSSGSTYYSSKSEISSLEIPETASDGTTTYTVTEISSLGQDTSDGADATSDEIELTTLDIDSGISSLKISDMALKNCTTLNSITTNPSAISYIGSEAFKNTGFSGSFEVPAAVYYIGSGAFEDTALTAISFASGSVLASLQEGAFKEMDNLQTLNFSNCTSSLEEFKGSTAYNCDALTSVTLPSEGVFITLGDSEFYDCDALTSITIPATVTSIGSSVFEGCDSLKTVTFETDSDTAALQSMGDSVFKDCASLATVDGFDKTSISGTIGSNNFSGCSSLSTIGFPSGITALQSGLLGDCTELTEVLLRSRTATVADDFMPTDIGIDSDNNCVLIGYAHKDEANEGEEFTDNTDFFNFAITNNFVFKDLDSAGDDTEDYYDGTFKIDNSGNLVYINYASTKLSNYLTDGVLTIPSTVYSRSLTGIAAYSTVFKGLSNTEITSVVLPESVKTIADNAFYNAQYIGAVTVLNSSMDESNIGTDAFYGTADDFYLYGTIGNSSGIFLYAMDNQRTSTGGTTEYIKFRNYIENGASSTSDPYLTVQYDSNTGYNTLIECVTDSSGSNVKTVVLPEGIECIGTDSSTSQKIFYGNEDLTSFTANGLLVIDDLEFQGDSGLTSVTLAISPTSIGTTPWRDCTSLPSVTISTEGTYSSDTTNGMIFEGSSSSPTSIVEALEANTVTKYAVPSTVKSIYPYAFYNRQTLQTLDLTAASGLTKIQNNTFEGMKAVKKVSIGQNMKTVATEAFKDVPDGTVFYVYSSSLSYSDDYDCFDPANGENSSDYYFYGTTADNSDNTYYMCNESDSDGLNWGGTTEDSAKTSLSSDNIASSPTKITKTIDDDTTEITIEKGTDFNLILTSGSTETTISTDEYYVSGTWYDSSKTAMEAAPDSEGNYYIMAVANTDSELYEGYRYIPVVVSDSSSSKTDISSAASWKPKGMSVALDDIKANSGLVAGDDADALDDGADFYLYLIDDDTAISTDNYYLGYYYSYTYDSSSGYSYTALEEDYPTTSGNFAVSCIAKSSSSDYTGTLYVRFTVTDGSSSDDDNKTSLEGNVYADPEPIEISLYDRSPATVTKGTDFNLYRVSDNALISTSYYNVAAYCDSSYSTLSSAPTSEGTYYVKLTAVSSTSNPWTGSIYVELDVYEEDPNKTSLSSDCYPKPSIIKKAIPSTGKTATVVKGTDFNIYKVSDNSLIDTSYYEVTGYLDSNGDALTGVPYEAGSYYVVVQPYSSDSEVTGTMKINMTLTVGGTLSINAIEDQYWTGSAITPDIKVTSTTDSDLTLTKGIDYTSAYSSNINAGAASVTATGISDYNGDSATATFSILKSIANCTVNATNTEYTGKATTPTVTITDGSKKLTQGTDFVISAIDKNVKVN